MLEAKNKQRNGRLFLVVAIERNVCAEVLWLVRAEHKVDHSRRRKHETLAGNVVHEYAWNLLVAGLLYMEGKVDVD